MVFSWALLMPEGFFEGKPKNSQNMQDAKNYLEKTHKCPVKVFDTGDWHVFKLDDNNPFHPVVGFFPNKGKIFYPRGANNYYFGKRIWTQKTLYLKKSGNNKKVVSGHLVVTANPSSNTLKLTTYRVRGLEVNLEHLFEHIKNYSAERKYLLGRLDSWLCSKPRSRIHSVEGYTYVKKLSSLLSSPAPTDQKKRSASETDDPAPDSEPKNPTDPTDPIGPMGELFNTLVSLCGNRRILIDQLLLIIDTIFLDKTDKSFVDSESPTYWRVDDKESKLLAAFKAIVDDGQVSPGEQKSRKAYNAHNPTKEPDTPSPTKPSEASKKKRAQKTQVQTIQTFKDRFAQVFNQYATMSDAWHPLHEASLQEMIHMPSTGSKGANIDTRYYQPDSLGFICFVYTKEGQDVGLVRFMAQGCHVSRAEPDTEIKAIIAKLATEPAPEAPDDPGDQDYLPVLLDGIIVGYLSNTSDPATSDTIAEPRVGGVPTLHWTQYIQHTSFGMVINISPNGGILYREVLDSGGNQRLITIQQQVHQPLIWDKDIFLPKPESFMSTMASSLPLIQHSSAVRFIFPCSQRKSAACGMASTKVYYSLSLTNPEVPRIQTPTEKRLEIKDGQNVVVGIMPFYGKNTEDSIVVSKEAVERGDFHTKIVDTHTLRPKAGQLLTIPHEIQVGAQVEFGQLLGLVCGKPPTLSRRTTELKSTEAVQDDAPLEDDVLDTITHQSTHVGQVIDIRQDRNQVQIVVETLCPLMVGDKLASRYGQKGVVSEMVPLMEMPYTADGVRPSILINPHAFPTRMTLGQMIESILVDKHEIGKDQSLEIKAFSDLTQDLSGDSANAAHDCMRVLYNPKTFQPYPEKVFLGIVYYHTLKHKVDRKIKARGRFGKRHQLTGQPLGSRKLNGGIRIGEMEMGILKAQRADSVLQEFYDIGDGIDARYCHTCARWDYGDLVFVEDDALPVRAFCGSSATNADGGSEQKTMCGPHTHHRVNRASLQLWEEAMAAGIQLRMETRGRESESQSA